LTGQKPQVDPSTAHGYEYLVMKVINDATYKSQMTKSQNSRVKKF